MAVEEAAGASTNVSPGFRAQLPAKRAAASTVTAMSESFDMIASFIDAA